MSKLAISGTHGTGKSFSVYEFANKYKIKYPNREICVITEIARKCPFPINQKTTIVAQQWMLSAQIKEELESEKNNDLVICDRSLVDYISYAKLINEDFYFNLIPFVEDYMKSYYKIFLKDPIKNNYCVDDGIRDMDMDFRLKIHETIYNTYELLDIPVIII